jgi:hypothetical protein
LNFITDLEIEACVEALRQCRDLPARVNFSLPCERRGLKSQHLSMLLAQRGHSEHRLRLVGDGYEIEMISSS